MGNPVLQQKQTVMTNCVLMFHLTVLFKVSSRKHAKILPVGDVLFILTFLCKLMPEDEHIALYTSLALYI